MSKQLRIGFIGSGAIAEEHVESLQRENVNGVSVVAASDVNESQLKKFGEKFGIKNLYSDWGKMLAEGDIDAVSVCTPNRFHYPATLDALRAGKHVLVEKPMAVTYAQAKEMVDEGKRAGKLVMIAFQYRFSPEAQMLRKYVKEGYLGNIVYAKAQWLRRRGIPSWGVFGQKEIQGGGSMIDIGVHVVEMAHYIMGSPKPKAAVGSMHTFIGDKPCQALCEWGPWDHETYTVEDLGVGFLTFEGGAAMSVETSFAAHIEKDILRVQVMGTKGGGSTDPAKVFLDQGGYMMTMEPGYLGEASGFDYKMRHFCECILNGVECEAPGEDGAMVQMMLEGMYESAERGEQVRF